MLIEISEFVIKYGEHEEIKKIYDEAMRLNSNEIDQSKLIKVRENERTCRFSLLVNLIDFFISGIYNEITF